MTRELRVSRVLHVAVPLSMILAEAEMMLKWSRAIATFSGGLINALSLRSREKTCEEYLFCEVKGTTLFFNRN